MKTLSKKWFVLPLLGLSLIAIDPPIARADPPPWAHGHKHQKYIYTYYPSSQVYYSPVRRGYYYMNNSSWVFAPTAPATVRLGRGVSIELGGPVPYVYHPTVIQQYPVVVAPY